MDLLPHPGIVRALAGRSVRLWLVVRVVMVVVPLANGADLAELLRWHPGGALVVLAVCVLLGFVDTRRRGERALLGNLGASDRQLAALFLLTAAAGELVLAGALGALALA